MTAMQRQWKRRSGRAVRMTAVLLGAVLLGVVIDARSGLRGHVLRAVRLGGSGTTPRVLDGPLRSGFRVVRRFSAVSSLTGWVLRAPDGRFDVVYTTQDGRALISGRLLTGSGVDLTQRYAARYVPKSTREATWTRLARTATFVVSGARHPKSVIYVIMDPNCIFCHMLWIALRPYEAEGLQVRWIPVGFLHADSLAKAAAVLEGGRLVLEEMQHKYSVRRESGGVPGIALTAMLRRELTANLALMNAVRVIGTPGIIYEDAARHMHVMSGMPMMSELPTITGLAARKETAPILARFNR